MKRSYALLVSFIGWSGSGKTTFMESCIRLLSGKGYRVYALKSTHMDIQLDTPGTDSYRLKAAGAAGVCLLTRNGSTVFLQETEDRLDRDRIHLLFPDADFILAEGFHGASDLRYEIIRESNIRDKLKWPVEELDGVITDTDTLPPPILLRAGIPGFDLNYPEEFINYLIEARTKE